MRRVLILSILLAGMALPSWATIAQHAGCAAKSSGSVTALTCTFTPTTGNSVVLFFDSAVAVSALGCADNNSNALAAGPTKTNTGINYASFTGTAIAGANAYTCTWTTSTGASITGEDYSGVLSLNTALSGNTASGSSGTASITVTTEDANDWIVFGLVDGANTLTTTVGSERQNQSTTGQKQVLVDNTSATPASVTGTATMTTTTWAAIAIELRTAASGVTRQRGQVIQE